MARLAVWCPAAAHPSFHPSLFAFCPAQQEPARALFQAAAIEHLPGPRPAPSQACAWFEGVVCRPRSIFAAILVVELAPEALLTRVLVCHDLRIDVARQVLARSPFPAFLALLSLLPLEVPLRMLQLSLQQFFFGGLLPGNGGRILQVLLTLPVLLHFSLLGQFHPSASPGRVACRASDIHHFGQAPLPSLLPLRDGREGALLAGHACFAFHQRPARRRRRPRPARRRTRPAQKGFFFFWGGVVGLRPGLGT